MANTIGVSSRIVRLSVVTALAVLTLTSCRERREPPREATSLEVLPSVAPEDTLSQRIASSQRRLLALLPLRSDSLAHLVADDFTLNDGARPEDQTRDIRGRMSMGRDYFKLLGREFPTSIAEVETMRVYPMHHGAVLVVANHLDLAPTVTVWELRPAGWKATRMTINAPDEVIEGIREQFESSPRSTR